MNLTCSCSYVSIASRAEIIETASPRRQRACKREREKDK